MSLQHEGCKRDTRSTEDKLLLWIQDVPHLIFSYSPETLTQCLVFFGLFGSLIILRVFFFITSFFSFVFSAFVFLVQFLMCSTVFLRSGYQVSIYVWYHAMSLPILFW